MKDEEAGSVGRAVALITKVHSSIPAINLSEDFFVQFLINEQLRTKIMGQ